MVRYAVPLLALALTACSSAPPSPPAGDPPPWRAHPAIPAGEVPPVLLEQWGRAENRDRCAPLAFTPLVSPSDEALPRPANFSGGWAVAWDLPGEPGIDGNGRACERCGRSAYGLAGTGTGVSGDTYRDWPNLVEWTDGSWAGWGLEGGTGPRFLAYVHVAGESCLYNIWSHLSEEHLERLVRSLRRIEVGP